MTTRRTTTMPTTTQDRPRTTVSAGPRADRRITAVLEQDLRCGCGQELDCCAGEHCPRCGHDLRHPQ